MIFNMVGGASDIDELNLKLVGGTSAPCNPSEGTVWVNTSTTITSWLFDSATPSNPSEGMVWVFTGDSSSFKFDALETNDLQVYPKVVRQYVNGAWVVKNTKAYKSGAWVTWTTERELLPSQLAYSTYLHHSGYSPFTVSGDTLSLPTIENNSDFTFVFNNAIDVTEYQTLKATVKINGFGSAGNYYSCIAVTSSKPTTCYVSSDLPNVIAKTFPSSTGTHEVEIDLSTVNRSVYIVVCGAAANFTVSNIRLAY